MCGSMADIQSAAAEIRRGKKEEEEERRKNKPQHENIMVALLHRATITKANTHPEHKTTGLQHQINTKLEIVSIAEPLQNRQHAQNP